MNNNKFDKLTKGFAQSMTRRRALNGVRVWSYRDSTKRMKMLRLWCATLGVALVQSVEAGTNNVNFDAFPDSSPVPPATVITNQYAPLGVVFSSDAGGPIADVFAGEASSPPNFLAGNPDSFHPIIADFTLPTSDASVTLISVGDATVTATAYAADLTTTLDTVSVSNPGTGVGYGNTNRISLSGHGESVGRIRFEITQPYSGDGFGIDDFTFTTITGPRLAVDLYAGLTIEGTVGTTNRIDYVTNVGDTNWITLTNLILPTSPYLFFDVTSARIQRRFYRAVQSP